MQNVTVSQHKKKRWVLAAGLGALALLCVCVFVLVRAGAVDPDIAAVNAGTNLEPLNSEPKETTTVTTTTTTTTTTVPYVRPAGIQEAPDGNGKLVALTFDDGPNPITLEVLESINKVGGHVTFFCLGNLAEKHADILKKVAAQGSEIASHSYAHKHLTKLTNAELKEDLSKAVDALGKHSGAAVPTLLRLPYGESTETLLGQINAPAIMWSVDPKDWKYSELQRKNRSDEQWRQDVVHVANSILDGLQDGDIVIMHDIYRFTKDVADAVIAELHHKGWKFVTVSELFEARGIALQPGVIYRSAIPKTEPPTEPQTVPQTVPPAAPQTVQQTEQR